MMEVELETVKERERELVAALHGTKGRGAGARRAKAKQQEQNKHQQKQQKQNRVGSSAVGAIEKAMEVEKSQRPRGKQAQHRSNPKAPGISLLATAPQKQLLEKDKQEEEWQVERAWYERKLQGTTDEMQRARAEQKQVADKLLENEKKQQEERQNRALEEDNRSKQQLRLEQELAAQREKWFEEEKQQFQVRKDLHKHVDDLTAELMLAKEQLARWQVDKEEVKENNVEEKQKRNSKIQQQQAKWERKERQLLGGLEPGQDRPPFDTLHQLYQLRKSILRAKAKDADANEKGNIANDGKKDMRPKSAAPSRDQTNTSTSKGQGTIASARPKSAAQRRKSLEYCGSSSVNLGRLS